MNDLKSSLLKRGVLPLLIILIVVIIGAFFVVRLVQRGTVQAIIKKDQPMGILFILNNKGNPSRISF